MYNRTMLIRSNDHISSILYTLSSLHYSLHVLLVSMLFTYNNVTFLYCGSGDPALFATTTTFPSHSSVTPTIIVSLISPVIYH